MRYSHALAFAAALCLLSACSSASPTAPGELRSDESGYLLGSGNRTTPTTEESGSPTGTGIVTPTPAPSAASHDGESAPPATANDGTSDGDTTTEDGGYLLGSGNRSSSTESPHLLGSGN